MANKIKILILLYLVNSISCIFKVVFDASKYQYIIRSFSFYKLVFYLDNLPSNVKLLAVNDLTLTFSESTSSDEFPLTVQLNTAILGNIIDVKLYKQQSYLKAPSLGSSILIKNPGDPEITESISDNLVKHSIYFK
jgi:hypothetical protein